MSKDRDKWDFPLVSGPSWNCATPFERALTRNETTAQASATRDPARVAGENTRAGQLYKHKAKLKLFQM